MLLLLCAIYEKVITIVLYNCTKGFAFNFTSTNVNNISSETAYHELIEILEFYLKILTRTATMYHHYERCDVGGFIYR
jgi:hypothetical protein